MLITLLYVSVGLAMLSLSGFWLSSEHPQSLPWLAPIFIYLVFQTFYDLVQKEIPYYRNFPLFGRISDFFSKLIWPEQLKSKPYSAQTVELIRARALAKNVITSFGLPGNLPRQAYRIRHSIFPHAKSSVGRVLIGAHRKLPYSASVLNASALGYGPVSERVVRVVNKAAADGHFWQNTGEDGLFDLHFENSADLVWQIGPGYFSCRDSEGHFDEKKFTKQAQRPEIKLIEIKISQGAKPGLGSYLPGDKVTARYASMLGLEAGKAISSSPAHSAFSSYVELLDFAEHISSLAGGKPVGIKLCVGRSDELESLVASMAYHRRYLDFITLDCGSGGTGAASKEFMQFVGLELSQSLPLLNQLLQQYDIRDKVKIIATGKIATSVDVFTALALGADICNSARAILLAMGCRQELKCHTGKCKSGIATQSTRLSAAIDVNKQAQQVSNYFKFTLNGLATLMAAAGVSETRQICRDHLHYESLDRSPKLQHMDIAV